MNSDRRTIVRVLAALTKVYVRRAEEMPIKALNVVRDEVKALIATEERSIKKMEAHKDADSTKANYENAVQCFEDLTSALDHLDEGELREALSYLEVVAEPVAPATPSRKKTK